MWSYVLNSIWTHKSCRYALEGALPGYATESVLAGLSDPNIIMFSERNSEGLADPNSGFFYIPQDDYDTWGGEGRARPVGLGRPFRTRAGSGGTATTGARTTSTRTPTRGSRSGAGRGSTNTPTMSCASRSRTRRNSAFRRSSIGPYP